MRFKQRLQYYKEILYIYQLDKLVHQSPTLKKAYLGTDWKDQVKRAILELLKHFKNFLWLLTGKKRVSSPAIQHKNWFYVISKNNVDAVSYVRDMMEDAVYVQAPTNQTYHADATWLSAKRNLWYFIKDLPFMLYLLVREPRFFVKNINLVISIVGLLDSYRALLRRYQPKGITFANDHSPHPRTLAIAAKLEGVPTFYIQHACVSGFFPPLCYTCAFLEGQDAEDKYRRIGPVEGEIAQLGVLRLDHYLERRNNSTIIQQVGICTNRIDDMHRIEALLKQLCQQFPQIHFVYRPHPNDSRVLEVGKEVTNLSFSNSKEEKAVDFLLKQDLIIAGNSSIHYEAVMLNVHSLYFEFSEDKNFYDYYGFVKNGLTTEVQHIKDILHYIEREASQRSTVYQRAKYYNALIGTEQEGQSAVLIRAKILELSRNNTSS